jgi:hypothetical protein
MGNSATCRTGVPHRAATWISSRIHLCPNGGTVGAQGTTESYQQDDYSDGAVVAASEYFLGRSLVRVA